MILRELVAKFGIQHDQNSFNKVEQGVDGIKNKIGVLGKAIVAAFSFNVAKNFIDDIRQQADSLDKISTQLGITTDNLQELQLAGNLAGVSTQELTLALVSLQKNAFNAVSGNAEYIKFFDKLGVTLTNSSGQLKPVTQLFSEFADGISQIEDPSTRTGLSMRLLEEGGRKLLPLFKNGSKDIKAAAEEFERLGGGLSQETINKSVELTDTMAKFDVALMGVKSTIAGALVPGINYLTDKLKQITGWFAKAAKQTYFFENAFIVLKGALVALGVVFAPIVIKFALIAAAISAVVLIVDELITLFRGGDTIVGDFIDSIFGIGTTKEVITDIKDTFNVFVKDLKFASRVASDLWETFSNKANASIESIKKTFSSFTSQIKSTYKFFSALFNFDSKDFNANATLTTRNISKMGSGGLSRAVSPYSSVSNVANNSNRNVVVNGGATNISINNTNNMDATSLAKQIQKTIDDSQRKTLRDAARDLIPEAN